MEAAMHPERSVFADLALAVRLAWSIGWIVAIPAVLFGFCGAAMDKAYRTSPLFLIVGLAMAMTLSGVGVWRMLKRILSTHSL